MKYRTGFIDPRPAEYRKRVNTIALNDLRDCARWGLHLSDLEHDWLTRMNPDTLGHDDSKLHDMYWKDFVNDPASKPYRIQEHI